MNKFKIINLIHFPISNQKNYKINHNNSQINKTSILFKIQIKLNYLQNLKVQI